MADSRYYKVVVSDKAKRMLGMHIHFITNVSKEAAREKKKELMSAIRSLARYPERYPYLEEAYIPSNKYHKMFVKEWYLILYQIKNDVVYVDHILDCRKDYDWLL